MNAHILLWLLSYLFNALWQIPLIFAAAWIVARMSRRAGPRVEHRIWVAALFLQIALPATSVHIAGLWQALLGLLPSDGAVRQGGVHILIGPATTVSGGVRIPFALEAGIVLGWACCVLYFAARLTWGLAQTFTVARAAAPLELTGDAAGRWARHCHRVRVIRPTIAVSSQAIAPVALGLRQGIVLLPPHFVETLPSNDLDAVLAHELAHIARRDFAKNLLYSLLSLPVTWHPFLWRTRVRLAESRELICDDAAAAAVAGRRQYAQSLLRLASLLAGQPRFATLQAVGILDFSTNASALERRIMTLAHQPAPMSIGRRILIASACSALAFAACTSALALHTDVSAPPQAASESHTPKKISVSAKVISGLKIAGENPVYPKEARAKKIEGAVVLDAIIGKDGAIESLHVVNSPAESLSKSALDAVRTWRYRPYLLNGEPVEVETTVNVVYHLGA